MPRGVRFKHSDGAKVVPFTKRSLARHREHDSCTLSSNTARASFAQRNLSSEIDANVEIDAKKTGNNPRLGRRGDRSRRVTSST